LWLIQDLGGSVNGYSFSDAVRRALQAAREDAAFLHHEYVGTEHILLGLLRTDDGVPIAALHALGVDPAAFRQRFLDSLERGKPGGNVGPDLPYTSRGKKVLEEAMKEARERGHSYVGTEHLFMGILREHKGLAAQALVREGLSEESVRAETIRILETGAGRPPAGSVASSFLIVIEDPNGQLGARRFTSAQDAIDFLSRLR
jgi:ATP-dependent Clp protease ATP-binding subunit ClpC